MIRYAVGAPVKSRVRVCGVESAPRTTSTAATLHTTLIVAARAASPPPGAGFATVIESVVGAASKLAGTVAVMLVGLRAVIATDDPFTLTTEAATKPVLSASAMIGVAAEPA